MTISPKHIQVIPSPDGNGYQVSYELGPSRKVLQFKRQQSGAESAPHGAGSYHDPEQHHLLMARIETYLLAQRETEA
jgi:hypothetical protein